MSSSSTNVVPKAKGVWKPGKQPGAGRKKGSLSRRTIVLRAAADNALAKGKTPLDTMLKNMRRFDNEGDDMYCELLDFVKEHKPGPKSKLSDVNEYVDKVMSILTKQRECRLDAQKCAVDCAGFVHPKLSAMQVNVTEDKVSKPAPTNSMTPEQKVDFFNKLRMRPASVVPLLVTIDNDTGDVID